MFVLTLCRVLFLVLLTPNKQKSQFTLLPPWKLGASRPKILKTILYQIEKKPLNPNCLKILHKSH